MNEWAAHDEYDEYAFIFGINTHNGQVNKCRMKQKKKKKREKNYSVLESETRYNKTMCTTSAR